MVGLYSDAIWPAGRILAKRTGLNGVGDNWLATSGTVFASVEAFGLQRVRYLSGDAHRYLAAGVGMAGAVVHGSKGWS
ncbi:hypothetical protein D3C76_1699190 [compost metagenome]